MPVIPQYQPSQSLNPQSGARFRAPDTPDLIGPALQQAAAQLKAAATEAEKRQAAEAESEANRRLAKYEYGVTGIMYGRPGEAGVAPTVGYTTLNGQQALDAEPEVRQALADLNTSVFDGASTEVADLLRPAISTASTRYERSLATHGNAQAEVARKASIDARSAAAVNTFVAARGDPEARSVALANMVVAFGAAADEAGMPADAKALYEQQQVGTAAVRAIQADIEAGNTAGASALFNTYRQEILSTGELGQKAEAAVADHVMVATAIDEANTDAEGLTLPDGSFDQARAAQLRLEYAEKHSGDPGRVANYTNRLNAIENTARTAQAQTQRLLVDKWTQKVLASRGNGEGLVGITDAERVALGTTYDTLMRWDPEAADAGKTPYYVADEMAASRPDAFIAGMENGTLLLGVSAEDAHKLRLRYAAIRDPAAQRTALNTGVTEAMRVLGPALTRLGIPNSGNTADEYMAANVAVRRTLDEIADAHPPGYRFTDRDLEVARNAGMGATQDRDVIAAIRGQLVSDVVLQARNAWEVSGITPRAGAMERSEQRVKDTDGRIIIALEDIPVADRNRTAAKLKELGFPNPTPYQIEDAFNAALKLDTLAAAQGPR